MTYAQQRKLGSSSCFFRSLEVEDLKAVKAAGINCIELSYRYEEYLEVLDFPNRAEEYAKNAALAGLGIWSIHLPFSRQWDISSTDAEIRNQIIETNKRLIQAAGRIGIQTAVLHPSSEPIAQEEREKRLQLSREAILELQKTAAQAGVVLAVENLPRTCLCNQADEMIRLLDGTGATVVFDTNHSLQQDNVTFLKALAKAGLTVQSLHISDYDGVDERHRLPGIGINPWNSILDTLEEIGYRGPLMYEVSQKPKIGDPVTLEMLADNMKALVAGDLG